jgi:plasmid stabilization system protein ParE
MKYIFHPDARLELEHSINYYEERQSGLGYDFSLEIFSTIRRIISNPKAWAILDEDIRRCITKRFPYGIIYSEQDDEIYILAVMHLKRDPEYWKYRVS